LQVTPSSSSLVASKLGVLIAVQVMPSQCSASLTWNGVVALRSPATPTAQQSAFAVQARELRMLEWSVPVPAGLGTFTVVHFVPFENSISLRRLGPAVMLPSVPAAQQVVGVVQRTLLSALR